MTLNCQKEIHSRSDRSFPLLRSCRRLHHAHCSFCHRINPTSQANRGNHGKMQAIPQLHGHTPRCHQHLQEKQHGTNRTQQRLIPQQTQSTQPSGRTFLPIVRHRRPDQQWGHSKYPTNHYGSHVLRSGSRSGRTLHQCTRSHPTMPNISRNGPQTAPNSNSNQQQHIPWSRKQQHTAPMHKSHGHEIPLAAMLQGPTPIPILLVPRPHQQGRLLDQAPLCSPPH
jgi:hypothetical protein